MNEPNDPPPPSWTTCPLPVCRGVVRERAEVTDDGDVQPFYYCVSCGHLV